LVRMLNLAYVPFSVFLGMVISKFPLVQKSRRNAHRRNWAEYRRNSSGWRSEQKMGAPDF